MERIYVQVKPRPSVATERFNAVMETVAGVLYLGVLGVLMVFGLAM